MNQTSKNLGENLTAPLPVNFSEMSQEEEFLFDARFCIKDKNVGYKQDMPSRKILAKQSISQVKKSLGFRPRTHYETMLKNPTSKLLQF